MESAKVSTQNSQSVIVQETNICNYAQTRYKLANALSGAYMGSASYGRGSASVSIDVNTLDQRVNQNTRIGRQMEGFTIGTQEVPLPIHVKVVPISIALNDHLWDEASLTVIRRKKVHMKKALVDYPANKRARISAGKYTSNANRWSPSDIASYTLKIWWQLSQ